MARGGHVAGAGDPSAHQIRDDHAPTGGCSVQFLLSSRDNFAGILRADENYDATASIRRLQHILRCVPSSTRIPSAKRCRIRIAMLRDIIVSGDIVCAEFA